MADFLRDTFSSLTEGQSLDRKTALVLARWPNQPKLWAAANRLRQLFQGDHLHLCSIINARSGNCTEDCRFCAQSARYRTGAAVYSMIDQQEALRIAKDNEAHGVHRLSLVSSGRSVESETLAAFAPLYRKMAAKSTMKFCASLGLLKQEQAQQLVELGVSRYHCNMESSRERFPHICSTHTWEDKVHTLQVAARAGLSLCSGGIIGMGESLADRIDLALELRDLGIRSIPINIFTPIAGTPLAHLPPLPLSEILTTLALFRFLNPEAVIRIAGGRQQLGAEQYRCFSAGANGVMVGNYLTTTGLSLSEDIQQLRELGFMLHRA
jgi:biotin synthase